LAINVNPLFYADELSKIAGTKNVFEIVTKMSMAQAEEIL
jgi:hypothetical protein